MGKEIDEIFRKAVMDHPKMAKSHFEMVDPGVWRFDVSGRLSGLGDEWIGPYQFCEGGVDYEAYGLRKGIFASQTVFLADLGISVPERGLSGLVKVVSVAIGACLLVAVSVWFYDVADAQSESKTKHEPSESQCVESECTDAAINEMFEKLKKRNLEKAARDKRSDSVGQPPPATVGKSIKERARDAFHASRWDEAINLVDQLSEKEADAELRYYIGICYKEG